MVSGGDIASGISGTLGMARGRADWQERMDLSAQAVFHSFWAMPLAIPAIVLVNEVARQMQLAAPGGSPGPVPGAGILAAMGLASTYLAWTAALFILARIAARTGAGWRVSPLIIGYNWSRLIASLFAGIGAALAILLGVPGLSLLVGFLTFVLAVWLEWGVVKRALGAETGPTIGILVMLFLVRFLAVVVVTILASPFLAS